MVLIGELSRRVGVRPETLRAWERRYGLFEPARSGGNYRLYSAVDEARARAMTGLLAAGISTAEAARVARESRQPAEPVAPELPGPVLAEATTRLVAAIEAYDDAAATALLDEAIAGLSIDAVLLDLVLPVLRELGERWSRGEVSIAQEHFGSELLRGRLLGLARGWGAGTGPLALLACPPGERHDLGLLAFGLALRERGWRIAHLGADTPPEALSLAAEHLDPALVVVAATEAARFEAVRRDLRALAERRPLLVGGAAANDGLARALGVAYRDGDAVRVAHGIAADTGTPAVTAQGDSPATHGVGATSATNSLSAAARRSR